MAEAYQLAEAFEQNLQKLSVYCFSLRHLFFLPLTFSGTYRPSLWKHCYVYSSVWGKAKFDIVDFGE